MKNIFFMPAYFQDFKCKCDKCRHSCCHGWNIPISQEEYFRLVSMDCTEELRHCIDMSFITPSDVSEEKYRIISFNWRGDCPIQKDGLCQIHANKGENMLPAVCRLYPRSLKCINGQNIACCSSSCERVVEMLCSSKSLFIKKVETDLVPTLKYDISSDLLQELFEINKIIQRKEHSIVVNIKEVCMLINKDDFIKDYNNDRDPLSDVLYILERLSGSDNFFSEIVSKIVDRYQDKSLYLDDVDSFEKAFPDYQSNYENIINNSLLYENFPFVDDRFDKSLAYKGLCATYGLLKVVNVAYYAINPTYEGFIDSTAALFHLIDHTAFYYNIGVLNIPTASFLKL